MDLDDSATGEQRGKKRTVENAAAGGGGAVNERGSEKEKVLKMNTAGAAKKKGLRRL